MLFFKLFFFHQIIILSKFLVFIICFTAKKSNFSSIKKTQSAILHARKEKWASRSGIWSCQTSTQDGLSTGRFRCVRHQTEEGVHRVGNSLHRSLPQGTHQPQEAECSKENKTKDRLVGGLPEQATPRDPVQELLAPRTWSKELSSQRKMQQVWGLPWNGKV